MTILAAAMVASATNARATAMRRRRLEGLIGRTVGAGRGSDWISARSCWASGV